MQFDRAPIGLRHGRGLDFGWRPAFERDERASEQRRDVIPVPQVNPWQSFLEDCDRRRDDAGESRHVAAPLGSLVGEERRVVGNPRRNFGVVLVRQHLEQENPRRISGGHAGGIDRGEKEARPKSELHRLALRGTAQHRAFRRRSAPRQADDSGDVAACLVRVELVDDDRSAVGLDHLPDAGLTAMPVCG